MSSIFKLSEPTTVYALRGGNGNDDAVINSHQIPGGGDGGASIQTTSWSTTVCNGGDGGSGSTGTSNISFLRIYKM